MTQATGLGFRGLGVRANSNALTISLVLRLILSGACWGVLAAAMVPQIVRFGFSLLSEAELTALFFGLVGAFGSTALSVAAIVRLWPLILWRISVAAFCFGAAIAVLAAIALHMHLWLAGVLSLSMAVMIVATARLIARWRRLAAASGLYSNTTSAKPQSFTRVRIRRSRRAALMVRGVDAANWSLGWIFSTLIRMRRIRREREQYRCLQAECSYRSSNPRFECICEWGGDGLFHTWPTPKAPFFAMCSNASPECRRVFSTWQPPDETIETGFARLLVSRERSICAGTCENAGRPIVPIAIVAEPGRAFSKTFSAVAQWFDIRSPRGLSHAEYHDMLRNGRYVAWDGTTQRRLFSSQTTHDRDLEIRFIGNGAGRPWVGDCVAVLLADSDSHQDAYEARIEAWLDRIEMPTVQEPPTVGQPEIPRTVFGPLPKEISEADGSQKTPRILAIEMQPPKNPAPCDTVVYIQNISDLPARLTELTP